MSNEKFYRYFKIEGDAAIKIIEDWRPISDSRFSMIKKVQDAFGAVTHTESRHWGGPVTIGELVFLKGHSFPCEVKVTRQDECDGKQVVVVAGKGRSKETKKFMSDMGAALRELNAELKEYPVFKDYVIDILGVRCSGLGAATNRGVAMLSTQCGKAPNRDDLLLFAIPMKSDGCATVEPSPSMQEITYGQFYDLSGGC